MVVVYATIGIANIMLPKILMKEINNYFIQNGKD